MFLHSCISRFVSYEGRLILCALCSILCALFVHRYRSHHPGWNRAPAALLTSAINFLLPTLFHENDEFLTVAIIGITFTWLMTFKVLGWMVNRGPISTLDSLTTEHFLVSLILPITLVSRSSISKNAGRARQMEEVTGGVSGALSSLFKFSVLISLVAAMQQFDIPRLFRELMQVLALYLFISVVMNLVGISVQALLGFGVAPDFDRPFLASSVGDFWSRRWNLNVGYGLRFLVYDPILEGRLIARGIPGPPPARAAGLGPASAEAPPSSLPDPAGAAAQGAAAKAAAAAEGAAAAAARPSRGRRWAAACGAFAVSGAMHELFLYYFRGRVSGRWMLFFSLQGPLVAAESAGRDWLRRRGLGPPGRWVSVPATLAGLLALGDALFFPPIVDMGLDTQAVGNFYRFFAALIRPD